MMPNSPSAASRDAAAPWVTVVLPVRNEAASIAGVLEDLRDQDLPRGAVEILVVDGRSSDGTREVVSDLARRDPGLRLLDNPDRRSSAARALGANAARGRYVAYVDGHCRIPSRTMLRDMVDLFQSSGAACLARPQPLLPTGGGRVARAISAARTHPFGHSLSSEIYGDREGTVSPQSSGAMYRREVLLRVGNFDPRFDACEDVELNYRVEKAGLKCVTSPRLAVTYEPRATFRGLLRQMFRYGLGRARLHRKHPEAFTWECLVPTAFVLGLVVLLVAPFLPAPLRLVLAAPYALYAVLDLAFAVRATRGRGLSLVPLVLLAFPLIHVGLGAGYLWGRLAPRPAATAATAAGAERGDGA